MILALNDRFRRRCFDPLNNNVEGVGFWACFLIKKILNFLFGEGAIGSVFLVFQDIDNQLNI